MLDVRRLLKFSPTEAIIMIANYGMGTQLRPEICEVDHPVAIDGTLTRVTIRSLPVYPDMIQNPYSGESTVEYNRYDLSEIFEQIVADITPPTTVYNLLDRLRESTGIEFDEDDFPDESINTESFVLRASSTSKRWVGEVGVTLKPSTGLTHISEWLTVNRHEGLRVTPRANIWDVFPNDILNGLEVGLPPMHIYLPTTEHSGLVAPDLPLIRHYLDEDNHDGLTVIHEDS